MQEIFELLTGKWEGHWVTPLFALSEILALLTIPSVLLQRQGNPRAALSWLLALFALPTVGVGLWWLVGRTSIARKRRIRAARAREFIERYGQPHNERGTPFDGLLPPRALGDSIFATNGNRVELLFDGSTAFPAMEAAIKGARRKIHVMFYIFRDDDTGRRFRDLLVEKARAGVTVRVLVDAWGTPRFTGKFSDPLREAGAKIAAFLPSHFMPIVAPRFNFANHRKMVVVDEAVGFMGGMNVGDEYRKTWRDIMVRLEGPAVRALDHLFLDDWFFASDDDVSHREYESLPSRDVACAVVASGPDRESYIHDAYFMLFTRATRRIWIVTPYFIPSDAIATALRTAASLGVDVRVVLPTTSDVTIAKLAARSFYPELISGGVKIFEYQGPMLHAKALVIDDDTCATGSANVDTRSFRLSFEVSCIFKDEDTTARLSAWFEDLFASSHQVTEEETVGRSTAARLLESAAHLMSPLL